MTLKKILIASAFYMVAHCCLHALQLHVLYPSHRAVFGDSGPPMLISPLHGLQVLCAWFFGAWSIPIMAPTAVILYVSFNNSGIYDVQVLTFVTMSAIYLASSPLSFYILRLCLDAPARSLRREWRLIMLAGFLSAVITTISAGIFYPLGLGSREPLVWLAWRVFAKVMGVFSLLVLLLALLRALAPMSARRA